VESDLPVARKQENWTTVDLLLNMFLSMLDALLSKNMTRREFLVHLGVILLAITGVTSLLNTLSSPNSLDFRKQTRQQFGSGSYGGSRKGVPLNG